MKLSAPIYRLKRDARQLARNHGIPLLSALDRVATNEGYSSWSLLAARYRQASPAAKILGRLVPGDLVLIGARPGQGKTMLALELAAEAAKASGQGAFFTLEYSERDAIERLALLGFDYQALRDNFLLDCSETICASYVVGKMQAAPQGSLIVIDYLQLLDQRRDSPPLSEQIKTLGAFAQAQRVTVVCIAQIQRAFEQADKPAPELSDVRLPNPADLSLFSKTCFLHNGSVALQSAG